MEPDFELVVRCQDGAAALDAKGLVLKEMAPKLLVQCIRKVHAGGTWIEREAGASALSPRELEVVRLVALGLRNKEIALQFSIGEGTVTVHLHNIYERLHVNGRAALTSYAKSKGLA